jgi:hypothetical protein
MLETSNSHTTVRMRVDRIAPVLAFTEVEGGKSFNELGPITSLTRIMKRQAMKMSHLAFRPYTAIEKDQILHVKNHCTKMAANRGII